MFATPLLGRLRSSVSPQIPIPSPDVSQRPAAVLLLVDPGHPSLPLLFVRRAANMRHHPGQIAFPGGRFEPGDATPTATALREAQEEVGLDPDNVEILGALTPMVTAVSDAWLTPIVGLPRKQWEVRIDPVEVAGSFRIGLADLMTATHETRRLNHKGQDHDVHFYTAGDRVIWGVTGAVLHELLGRLGRTD